jgi:phosphatidylglycerophosphate synthase
MQASNVMSSPRFSAALPVAIAAAAAIGGAVLLERALALDARLAARTGVLAAGGGALVLWLAVTRLVSPKFGAANTVTLARGALTVLLLALAGIEAGAPLAWALVALATVAASLDAVDGALARKRAEASAFGARFDMEVDALLILVLAVLVVQHGKAGAWILLAGLLRYAFVAASYVWPWLGAELPPSRRRQAVCVVQIVSLIGALAPIVVAPWSAALAFAGLVFLIWSFGIDVAWLARRVPA